MPSLTSDTPAQPSRNPPAKAAGGYAIAPYTNLAFNHGGVGDAVSLTGIVTLGAGSTAATIHGAQFVASDAGKSIVIAGAGTRGRPLVTRIIGVISGTQVNLDNPGETALLDARGKIVYGTDNSTAFQDFMNAVCQADMALGPGGIIPFGNYLILKTISVAAAYSRIEGEGNVQSVIECAGIVGPAFKLEPIDYFCPTWGNFAIIDSMQSTTTCGIDARAVKINMNSFELKNLRIYTSGPTLACFQAFSGRFVGLLGASEHDHTFLVACGPSVTWDSCYALTCGAGKAGYRLAGGISLLNCNGLNRGDWWGVFGSDSKASDGFENDFPFFSYPAVVMINCNVEHFDIGGLCSHASYQSFNVIGGSIDRDGKSSPYRSLVMFRNGSNIPGKIARLGFAVIFLGKGVPTGNGRQTNAFVSLTHACDIEDSEGSLTSAGIPGAYLATYDRGTTGNGIVPFLSVTGGSELERFRTYKYSSLQPRRLTLEMMRYQVPAIIKPVGNDQTIDVTGATKVVVAPGVSASVRRAVFNTATVPSSDFGRNGDLLIEAGSGYLKLLHSASGAFTFRLVGKTDVLMEIGQILRFCLNGEQQWVQC